MKVAVLLSSIPLLTVSVFAAPITSSNPVAALLQRQEGLPEALTCPASAWPPTTVGTVDNLQALNGELLDLLSQVLGENNSPARNLGRFIREVTENTATNMTVAIINRLDRFLRGGDHTPFLNAGYLAVCFTELYEDYRH